MLKYATFKLGSTSQISHKKLFSMHKSSMCNKISYLNKSSPLYAIGKFDCDYTMKYDNCTFSMTTVENIPIFLEICTNCNSDYCKLIVK